ncbi:MAG TPA: RNA polymerase sigma-70 factor [Pedobacter sp.]
MPGLEDLLDEELMSLVQADDQKAFSEIYNRYKGILVVHAYKKLGDFEDAKDVVQESFSVFWNNRSAMKISSNLSGFLYTMVSNKVLNLIKHRGVAFKYASSFRKTIEEHPNPTEIRMREKDMAEIIQKEIDALPPKMRMVFLLSRKEHLSHKEIAAALDISEFTVKNHMKSALKILRQRLGLVVFLLLLMKL